MRVLISAVGTRGDVQPALALANQVRELGWEARLAVPPNFLGWADELGFAARPVGVEMRAPRRGGAAGPPPTLPDLIADQFEAVGAAAAGCDLIVGAGAHQYAARSIAQARGVPIVAAVYAPVSLPSPNHPPPGQAPPHDGAAGNARLWEAEKGRWNARALDRVNAHRAQLGLAPIADLLGHILGEAPWLAADPVLGPAPADLEVVQTGAWMLADAAPLLPALEAFLEAGDPPVYLGFGSMPAAADVSRPLIAAVRAVGRRAILSAGWAELAAIDEAADCLVVDDVNHQALFARVAAVVHHGGAGTTTAAARAGAAQVVAAMFADQFYWGRRVSELGVGATLPAAGLDAGALAQALEEALNPAVAARAAELAGRVRTDGAAVAANRLATEFGG
jgi:vancomycin aglycone glucosyltransferase